MVADVDVYLLENCIYEANYRELLEIPVRPEENRRYEVLREIRIGGAAVLNDDGELMLDGLRKLRALQLNDKPAVTFFVEHDLQASGIKGQNVTMVMVTGTDGKDPYRTICP